MATKEKELEDRLQEFGSRLTSPPSSVNELLPILDQVESFLSRVEQSPTETMLNSLRPLMTALVSKEFLGHSDTDVKVAVASCLSEITRITAPEAPYDDDLMKEVFQRIVGSFEHLDDKSSRSFAKRVAILETVAKVRSCVVMLDLECDTLILEMFRHFLKTIRSDHTENILTSMETIMTLVLEESEDISSELLSCLLDCIKVDNKDILPIARKLVEKVITNCAAKLKPYLRELFQSLALSKYTEIVASLCQDSSDGLEKNEADDSKQSDRTVSDELPQGSAKLEQEVGCSGGTSAGKSPEAVTSNGTVVVGNGESAVVPSSPKQKSERSRRGGLSKRNNGANKDGKDDLELVAGKIDTARKMRGRQVSSSSPHNDGTELQSPSEADDENVRVTSPKDVDTSDVARRKSGRPSSKLTAQKLGSSAVAQQAVSTSRRKGTLSKTETEDKAISSQDNGSEKELDASNDSEGKSAKCSGKNLQSDNVDDTETPVNVKGDSEMKSQRQSSRKGSSKVAQGESLQKRDKLKPEKDKSGELSLKEMISSPKSGRKVGKPQGVLEESAKPKSGSKRAYDSEEITETPIRSKEIDESLLGRKIKVWWPDDKQFYEGIVESYDSVTKRHKIIYDDGDVEILFLKKERWELVKHGNKTVAEQAKNTITPDASSEGPRGKRTKLSSSTVSKQNNRETKSDMESGSAPGELPKRKGRPPKSTVPTNDESPSDSNKVKEKSAGKSGTKLKKDDAKSKDDAPKTDQSTPKSSSKSKDDVVSTGSKVRKEVSKANSSDDSPVIGRKSRGSAASKSSGEAKANMDAEASESRAPAGKKRKRKGQN